MPFIGSHAWKIRQKVGHDLLLLPAASVIVTRDDGAILLMERVESPLWSIIGGYAEEGASFRDTAITELKEEAGIIAKPEDLIPFATVSNPKMSTFSYPNGDKVQAFAQCFILHTNQPVGETLDLTEVKSLQFFPLDALPGNLATPTRNEIAAYKAYLKTGQFQTF